MVLRVHRRVCTGAGEGAAQLPCSEILEVILDACGHRPRVDAAAVFAAYESEPELLSKLAFHGYLGGPAALYSDAEEGSPSGNARSSLARMSGEL